ncbi:MAG: polyprenyl synthetase family protein [Phycisphaeraceae bacterium]|nr:polyprenyl synthetase family protein [Phycisphaeraceae bacterium]
MASMLDVPADLLPVHQCVSRTLARVEERIASALASDLPPVERLCRHVEKYRGKMIRPTLVALAAMACRPDEAPLDRAVTEAHIVSGAVCEMVHLATLVHDDVLDEADVRRRAATVNSLHGNEAAVILGDYLFSAAYRLCATLDTPDTTLLIGTVGMTLCAGELLQLHNRQNFSLDENTYFEIVDRKTASLIAAACRLGARHAGAGPDAADRFESFGRSLGIAFQIQDDLLDLTGDQAVVGKSLGKDLEKGKLTLPLIHHLASSRPEQRGRTLTLLEATSGPHQRGAAEDALAGALADTGSIDHARRTAERLVAQAKSALAPLPESPARSMLLMMADAVVTRAF